MKLLAPILLAAILCGCAGPRRVSVAEFRRQYAWVEQPQTMYSVCYLGECDARAYIGISSMSWFNKKKWSQRTIYVELSELEPAFRDALPERELKKF